ncbi:hypothetical protein [Streptomyces sp. NBC_01597]|uniref:hypothetical protein n=1 Tax=Streptomyces sp. NBC_01597 TaxID=2975891 RepID=UPI00386DB8E0
MFTAGGIAPVRAGPEKLAAMRARMRAVSLGEEADVAVTAAVGWRRRPCRST